MRCPPFFDKVLETYNITTVLDVGGGSGHDKAAFEAKGKQVDIVDLNGGTYTGDYNRLFIPKQYSMVWCSHCLEHQLNVHTFLQKLISNVEPDGVLAIIVPPLKHQVVGGHLSLWNVGLLMYRLILAGLDCSEARGVLEGYNVCVAVQNKPAKLPELAYDKGDIEKLAHLFPFDIDGDNFNGDIP